MARVAGDILIAFVVEFEWTAEQFDAIPEQEQKERIAAALNLRLGEMVDINIQSVEES